MGLLRPVLSMLIAASISARSLHRKSLSPSGALAGFVVLTATLMAGPRFGAIILAFFFSSSTLTKVKADEKKNIEEDHKEGGQRDWSQVLANSAVGTILSICVAYATGFQDRCFDTKEAPLVTGLLGGILGHYACCNGDTWSSEIGVLSSSTPRLITTFRQVPRGTNGGVSLLGLFAAAAGGAFIGLTFFIVGYFTASCTGRTGSAQWLLLPIGTAVGLLGSLFDSVLGATVQFSGNCAVRKKVVGKPGPTVKRISGYDILTNTGVNFVSALLMSLATAAACLYIF
ncbi:hypothetical protein MPTK1_6g01860 [Marchantia polymorpha subsp. ruderalis]|uniref:Transmembrane protein 19 n=2 Tax=Marchantia polymorpha TaxID=3197 RepID=A0A176W0Y7_MARPO|nr:hypothetical protein AXG93_3457s1280 [Marchantia polymorpha subsp. ruderalis]PTQ38215.1 hypothetical protein MARPO_0052s0018 [Marchantia polymorpha]BBN13230.1 hypothetical protein Mp_6g01860 [Marchantia polymorpha subsp. ruderalis]|eukprot:PTQ38215.1 hypothetical protein MARPO_0052s0018 [Marchantia polymorpha]